MPRLKPNLCSIALSRHQEALVLNSDETEFMCFSQDGIISSLNGKSLKLKFPFTYLGCNISSTECDLSICIGKAWTAIENLSTIWKFGLFHKIKWKLFQAVAVSVLLYGCTTWTLTKCLETKLNVNFSRMLHAILNKS